MILYWIFVVSLAARLWMNVLSFWEFGLQAQLYHAVSKTAMFELAGIQDLHVGQKIAQHSG
jgi:hypothetical protein